MTLYNNINSQLDATVTKCIDNYNQLNMFRAIFRPSPGAQYGAFHRIH